MKVYTKQDLALVIKQVIDEKYSNPQFLYEQLKTNINGKIKANNKQVLTSDELKEKGLKSAEFIIKDLYRIKIESLENKISHEVITAISAGVELADYKDYIFQVAKESVREFINAMYKYQKAQIKKHNKKR